MANTVSNAELSQKYAHLVVLAASWNGQKDKSERSIPKVKPSSSR